MTGYNEEVTKIESFKAIGKMDPDLFASLRQKVAAITTDQWASFRGKKFFKSQPDSDTIIIMAAKDVGSTIYADGMDNFELQELFATELTDIYSKINDYIGEPEHTVIRAQIIRLPARCNVFPHVDMGRIFKVSRRVHLPIITNEKVDFFINIDKVPMEEGLLMEINNLAIHCVFNQSDYDRVHLIIDWGHKDFGSK